MLEDFSFMIQRYDDVFIERNNKEMGQLNFRNQELIECIIRLD